MTYGYRLRCMASNRKTRVLLSSRKNLIALMAYRVTKPYSPRGSMRANVETMGGSAPVIGAAAVPSAKPTGARLSDIRHGALQSFLYRR